MVNIIAEAESFVKKVFEENLPEEYTFHNYQHTDIVRGSALKLAKLEGLSESETEWIELATLFHDVGYISGKTAHELKSSKVAEDWLIQQNFSEDIILTIKSLILSTNMEVEPVDKLERIMKDADLSHLGRENFQELSALLRREIENVRNEKFGDVQWVKLNLEFFNKHQYFSESGIQLYNQQKEQNLKALQKMLDDKNNTGESKDVSTPVAEEPKVKKKKKAKAKVVSDRPEKGIETMFRVSLRNHVQLSRLADNKANIMLSINAVVISVVLTSLLPKLDTNTFLQWPTFILLTVCIVSIIFATLSTIPNVTKGTADRKQIAEKKVNLLFFGNFHDMDLDDYTWGMNFLMNDREYLYNSLIKDLFFLGKVLHKKYKFLRITYTVFMIGIIIATFSFVYALLNRV